MRKAFLLLLMGSFSSLISAQPTNDNCNHAQNLTLKMPSPCPGTVAVEDAFSFSNIGATATIPFPSFAACGDATPQSAADVWFRFTPTGNSITITLAGGLSAPFTTLFESGEEGCGELYPVACASGSGSLQLSTYVDPSRIYYLLVSGGSIEDQGEFRLRIRSANDCDPCILGRQGYFTSSPAPVNGTYSSGQRVHMCYVASRWNADATGEYLHGLELDFGPGWDLNTLDVIPPLSCSGQGSWGYYDQWTSSATGGAFGPGFAFESSGADYNPGNNRGMGGSFCANIGIDSPPLSFCWFITAAECPPGEYGVDDGLSVSVHLLGDGLSGAGPESPCFVENWDNFLAGLYCPDPLEPHVAVINESCNASCDGAFIITGGGQGPWDYAVTDTSGNVFYSSANSSGADTVPGLCPGLYAIHVFSIAAGQNHTVNAVIVSTPAPVASATYKLPCFEGEPIELYGQSTPSAGATYSWTGPNGFQSTEKNPLALYPGAYTLAVAVNGCSSAPFLLEVPPVSQAVATIDEDTIVACPGEMLTITASGNATSFTWYANYSSTPVGAGPSLTIIPEDGAVYRVTGFNDSGCVGSDAVAISIPFQPSLHADTTGTLCPETPVTLSVSEGEQFLWNTGDTTASITVSPAQSSLYTVTATGPSGCAVSLSAIVQVYSGAGIFISPDAAICAGESASLFAGGGEVAWSTGDSSATLLATPLQTTIYTASITTAAGCVFEREVTVTVSPAPAITLVPADTAALCRGDSLHLLAYDADSLIWDTLVAPFQSATYALPGASSYGCQEIGSYTVIVNPLPTLSIMGDNLVCSSDSILLIAGSDGALLWSTGETNDSIYVLPTGSETYSVTATSAEGCIRTDSVQATQAEPPAAPQVNCSSSLGRVVFSWPVEPGLTYGLRLLEGPAGIPMGNNQYVVSGLLAGQQVRIELEAVNAAGCAASTQASCTSADCSVLSLFTAAPDSACSSGGPVGLVALVSGGSGAGSGNWSGPGVNGATNTFGPAIAGTGVHELVYTYADAGCVLSDTLQITVVQSLEASMAVCSAGPSSVTFSWPALPQDTAYIVSILSGQSGQFTGPTTYQVSGLHPGEEVFAEITALGAGACEATTITASCITSECPVLEAPADTMACPNSNVRLSVDPDGWDSFSWTPATGLSCSDCPNPIANPVFTTTYTIVASNAAGCSDTAKVTLYIEEIPDHYIPDGTIYFCEGEPFELCLPEIGSPIWIGANAFVSTERCLRFDPATAANAGPYFVILRAGGCRFIKRFILQPAPPVEVLAISGFQAVCPDETFTLFVEAENAVSYQWSPSEYLDCPTCPVTQGSVPQTATFTVKMTTAEGCAETAMATVFVDACQPRPADPPVAHVVEKLRFYPNPASNSVQLELPGEGEKIVQLWNSSGMLLREFRSAEATATLPLESIPEGAYLLKVAAKEDVRSGWLVVSR